MNKQRREALQKISEELADIKYQLETIAGEEEDYFDNMPEGLQSSDKGEKAEADASDLGDAYGQLEDIINLIDGVLA